MINKLKPALLGGLVTGILSVIPLVSTCCCLWAMAGGVLACFLYIKSSAAPVSTGEGAVLGVMAGAIGALVYLIIGLPISLIFGAGQIEEAFRRSGLEIPLSGIALVLLSVFLTAILIVLFSTLGGLIGVPIFEKRKGAAPPPPPQDLGGPAGTYGAGL
jgi:hypothetical protein